MVCTEQKLSRRILKTLVIYRAAGTILTVAITEKSETECAKK
jgi:hypothetical protein